MTNSGAKPIRFGMIGCGALGLVHAQRLSALPGVTVTAVSDPDPSGMERVMAVLPGNASAAGRFADYRELLQYPNLDAVCISSPNRWHVEQLLASLERGLDVLCEKPLSMIPDEVRSVVSATAATRRTVSIAYQSRYRRDSRILRRALQSGRWGRITSVTVFSCEDWITPNVGTWRHDPARCPGGFFADANGHQIDNIFWMTGLRAVSIRATIENRGTPVPMFTWGEARLVQNSTISSLAPGFGEGTLATSTDTSIPFTFTFAGDAHHWGENISIQTERADFHMRDTRLLWTDGSGPLSPFPAEDTDPEDLDPADTPDTAFVAALRADKETASPPHSVWPVLTFTLAAIESAQKGIIVSPQIPSD